MTDKFVKDLYFAFGANLNPHGMKERCPNAEFVCTHFLYGRRLVFREGLADTVEDLESFVPGVLWKVTPQCVKALDRFEGYPDLYNRKSFKLDGNPAFFYKMKDGGLEIPNSYYYSVIQEGYEFYELPYGELEEAFIYSAENQGMIA